MGKTYCTERRKRLSRAQDLFFGSLQTFSVFFFSSKSSPKCILHLSMHTQTGSTLCASPSLSLSLLSPLVVELPRRLRSASRSRRNHRTWQRPLLPRHRKNFAQLARPEGDDALQRDAPHVTPSSVDAEPRKVGRAANQQCNFWPEELFPLPPPLAVLLQRRLEMLSPKSPTRPHACLFCPAPSCSPTTINTSLPQ